MIQQLSRSLLAVVAVATILVVAACTAGDTPEAGTAQPTAPATVTPVTVAPSPATSTAAPASAVTSPAAAEPIGVAPASVSIASIGVDQALIGLDVAADGTLEVPSDFGDIGWFTGGGKPGGRGPVVLVGHLDSPTGPAVFARLAELRPGDVVAVTDVAGTVHRYRVTASAEHTKANYPSDEVFGATPTDELRLITCSGVYDRSGRTYLANRIVSAVRI